jgi:hypothetical protein
MMIDENEAFVEILLVIEGGGSVLELILLL